MFIFIINHKHHVTFTLKLFSFQAGLHGSEQRLLQQAKSQQACFAVDSGFSCAGSSQMMLLY